VGAHAEPRVTCGNLTLDVSFPVLTQMAHTEIGRQAVLSDTYQAAVRARWMGGWTPSMQTKAIFTSLRTRLGSPHMALTEFLDNSMSVGAIALWNATKVSIYLDKEPRWKLDGGGAVSGLSALANMHIGGAGPSSVASAPAAPSTNLGFLTFVDNGVGMSVLQHIEALNLNSAPNATDRAFSHFGTGVKDAIARLSTLAYSFSIGLNPETGKEERSIVLFGEDIVDSDVGTLAIFIPPGFDSFLTKTRNEGDTHSKDWNLLQEYMTENYLAELYPE
jgi:hypothetical protein